MTRALPAIYQPWQRHLGARAQVFAHRGARHAAPENTLAAFELARDEEADGVELDIRLSQDGVVVVAHDPTLERVTEGRHIGRVDQLSYRALQQIPLQDNQRIPSLLDVLNFCKENNLKVNVELKGDLDPPPAPKTLLGGLGQSSQLTIQHPLSKQLIRLVIACTQLFKQHPELQPGVLFSSFNPALMFAMRKRLPQIPAAWLVSDEPAHLLRWSQKPWLRKSLGLAAVHPKHSLLDEQRIQAFQPAETLINVWTVNQTARALALDALGVDAIITDHPGKILAALRAKYAP